MKPQTIIARAKSESADFGRYAEVMLEEVPNMSLPVLRDCYKHHATAGEYRASLERIRRGAQRAQQREGQPAQAQPQKDSNQ